MTHSADLHAGTHISSPSFQRISDHMDIEDDHAEESEGDDYGDIDDPDYLPDFATGTLSEETGGTSKKHRQQFLEDFIYPSIDNKNLFYENLGLIANAVDDLVNHGPSHQRIKYLLESVATFANIALNDQKVGNLRGTWKHTVCQRIIQRIQYRYKVLNFLGTEQQFTAGHDAATRLDVIWRVSQNEAIVYDYKFGSLNNASTKATINLRGKILAENGIYMKGHYDIRPQN
ncbi:MAG: hypothetical protein ACPGXY_00510 [Alphaproteobacteria bacterium]